MAESPVGATSEQEQEQAASPQKSKDGFASTLVVPGSRALVPLPTPCRQRSKPPKGGGDAVQQPLVGVGLGGRTSLSSSTSSFSVTQSAAPSPSRSPPSTRTPSPAPSSSFSASGTLGGSSSSLYTSSAAGFGLAQTQPIPRSRRPSRVVTRIQPEALLAKEQVPGLEDTFWKLCAGNTNGMECRSFAKLCKVCSLLDSRFTEADADLIFASATARGPRRLDAQKFETALRLLAERKCLPPEVIFDKIKSLQESEGMAENLSKFLGPRACASLAPPTPLKKTPSMTSLETPPRHRLLSETSASAGPVTGAQLVSPAQRSRETVLSCSPAPPRPSPTVTRPKTAPDSSGQGSRLVAASPQLMRSRSSAALSALPPGSGAGASPPPTFNWKRPMNAGLGEGGAARGSGFHEKELLLDTFASFCWGREGMDGRGFARICRDCNLLDSKFTSLDADLLFTKCLLRGMRRLDLDMFDSALSIIAERRGVPESTLRRSIAFCPGPLVRATHIGYRRLHDDRGGYTGTHTHGGPESGALGAGTVATLW